MEADKKSRFLMDEIGQMPLVIKMNGSKFRWEAFKMAYEMQPRRSFDAVKKTAQEIIDWVNNEPQFPPMQNKPENERN